MSVSSKPAEVTIQKQIQLPFSKAWQISLQGIRIRWMRSLITASGIFLGIAFFSSVRTGGLFPVDMSSKEAVAAANRQTWLAVMALLVCFVGIMNAMLMSVTERFKEIGTMKCLGALDNFVVKLFFIEAALMGTLASLLGWLVGWLIMVLVHLITQGTKGMEAAFWGGTARELALSVLIGIGITLLAAIPPARRAAQMPPIAALRSEI
jgi:ABC-type antimicrobial peptide transport system permease subunit